MKRLNDAILKLWINSVVFGVVFFSFFWIYLWLSERGVGVVYFANQALAETAMVLIGMSFALSGVAYFWPRWAFLVVYRKYLGLTGFWFALFHGMYSFANYFLVDLRGIRFDASYVWVMGSLRISNWWPLGLGVGALLILIMMAVVSNKWAVERLGGRRWRYLLRVGYAAYVMAVFHIVIKRWGMWQFWWMDWGSFWPPLSLLTTAFAVSVIGLRVCLQISIWKKAK